jgi:hypothetical protein
VYLQIIINRGLERKRLFGRGESKNLLFPLFFLCQKGEKSRKIQHKTHPTPAHLVDKCLKSVDNSGPLDKNIGFLVRPVKFLIMREMPSWTAFLAF